MKWSKPLPQPPIRGPTVVPGAPLLILFPKAKNCLPNLQYIETGNDPIVDFPGQQRLVARKINNRMIAPTVKGTFAAYNFMYPLLDTLTLENGSLGR